MREESDGRISSEEVSKLVFYAQSTSAVIWKREERLGEMELRVGSNIMIHFLYILLFLVWHMYLYIIHC